MIYPFGRLAFCSTAELSFCATMTHACAAWSNASERHSSALDQKSARLGVSHGKGLSPEPQRQSLLFLFVPFAPRLQDGTGLSRRPHRVAFMVLSLIFPWLMAWG